MKLLKQSEATPEQIRSVVKSWREKWPGITITDMGIANQWDTLIAGYKPKEAPEVVAERWMRNVGWRMPKDDAKVIAESYCPDENDWRFWAALEAIWDELQPAE